MKRDCCPACKSFDIRSRFQKSGYLVWICVKCGTSFVRHVPDYEELRQIYAGDEYYDLPAESIQRIRNENRRRLRTVREFKKEGKILDIGCVQGDLLDEAQRCGFLPYGIELSLHNVNVSQAKGHTVFHGDLEAYVSANGTEKKFDVISCLDVIEHVTDPSKFLGTASSLLKDDGVMILSTPNYSGLLARVLKEKEPFMIPPEHLNFFTKDGMVHLFKTNGLEQKRYLTFGQLTDQERKRVAPKYFPGYLQKISGVLEVGMPLGLRCLNFLKVGMEHEFYLAKIGKHA